MAESHLYLVQWLQEPLGHWHLQRLVCLAQCILALIECRTVSLERLALEFVALAESASVVQRLRRFLNECAFAVVDIPILLLRFLPSTPWILTLGPYRMEVWQNIPEDPCS